MTASVRIGSRRLGPGEPVYIVAEVSANHNQDFQRAADIIHAAKEAGADAIKLQTYTADTLTLKSDRPCFRIEGTMWAGRTLHDLYGEAYTPWDWQPRLKEIANVLGMDLFSSAFDPSAVDFLEKMGVPCHKVASFEAVDLPLIEKMARTGKPLIISTGMADLGEIQDAVGAARNAGAQGVVLLKCTSAYPADPADMNLRTLPNLAETFGVAVGLSDHTPGHVVPVAAVALGACLIEKHLTLSRADPGPDSAFSMEPDEFRAMVQAVRTVEQALGRVSYQPTPGEAKTRMYRRSLFAVKDIRAGAAFTPENVRSIRPGHGLAPKFLPEVLTRKAAADIAAGTPLDWSLISPS